MLSGNLRSSASKLGERDPRIEVGGNFSLLAGIVVPAVVYGELLPFTFVRTDLGGGLLSLLHGMKFHASPMEDMITNMLIFAPIGLLMTLHFARGTFRWWPAILVSAVFCASLGGCLELLQTYLPIRVASLTDVIFNTVGGLGGALIAPRFFRLWRQSRTRLGTYLAVCPYHALWLSLATLIVLAALAPFDFGLAPDAIRTGLARCQWWPLMGSNAESVAGGYGVAGPMLASGFRQAGLFAALAFLGVCGLRELGHGSLTAVLVTVRRVVVLAIMIECLQVLTGSHVFEFFDILLELAGAAMGICLCGLVHGYGLYADDMPITIRDSRVPIFLGLLVCLSVQAAEALMGAREMQANGGNTLTWLPFYREFFSPMALAATTIGLRFGGFCIIAFLILMGSQQRTLLRPRPFPILAVLCWACLLEAGRWYGAGIPAGMSGPVLALTAGMMTVLVTTWGMRLAAWAEREWVGADASARPDSRAA